MTDIHVIRSGVLVDHIKSRDEDDLAEKHGDYQIHEKQLECPACSAIDALEWAVENGVVTIVTFDDDMAYWFGGRNPKQVESFLMTIKEKA